MAIEGPIVSVRGTIQAIFPRISPGQKIRLPSIGSIWQEFRRPAPFRPEWLASTAPGGPPRTGRQSATSRPDKARHHSRVLSPNPRVRRGFPSFPKGSQASRMIPAAPWALRRFESAMRMWISAVCRSRSIAAMRSSRTLRQGILARSGCRRGIQFPRFRHALQWYWVARRGSFRMRSTGQSTCHGSPFLRIGMIGKACPSVMQCGSGRVMAHSCNPFNTLD
jgi:hypothetical protein